jgi:HK97 family phage prohead protease
LYNVEAIIANQFREVIRRGAFRDSIVHDDIRASFNHDLNMLLGRKSAGTLSLSDDAKGLCYSIALNPNDPIAVSIAAKIERHDVAGSSFWFVPIHPDDEEWEQPDRSGLPLRTFHRVRLIELGPVAMPTYAVTARDAIAERNRLRVSLERARLDAELSDAKAWRP